LMEVSHAIPPSTIASLSSGAFVGFVADNPEQRIPQKIFHCELQNDHEGIRKEEAGYKPIPAIAEVSERDVYENYQKIKRDIRNLVQVELKKFEAPEKPVAEKQKPVKKRAIRASVKPVRKGKTVKEQNKEQEQALSM
jgi:hypothetical protein